MSVSTIKMRVGDNIVVDNHEYYLGGTGVIVAISGTLYHVLFSGGFECWMDEEEISLDG